MHLPPSPGTPGAKTSPSACSAQRRDSYGHSDNVKFNYTLNFDRTNFRDHPELYRIGRGEQGVLLVEPYKGEILPHWRFKTPDTARASAARIYEMYEAYKAVRDFVGMDMARKYLQMGWTRSMRYANRRSGRKYLGPVPPDKRGRSGAHGRKVAPKEPDAMKLESAGIFSERLDAVLADPPYIAMREEHKRRHETPARIARKASARKRRG